MTHSFPTRRSSYLGGGHDPRNDQKKDAIAQQANLALFRIDEKLLNKTRGGLRFPQYLEIGRAHVSTPVTNAKLECRLLLEQKNQKIGRDQFINLDTIDHHVRRIDISNTTKT